MSPIMVLQFGAGRFLRGFVDRVLDQAGVGKIAVVQSTAGCRAALLSARRDPYPVAIRGRQQGKIVDRVEWVGSIDTALVAAESWPAVLELARSPALAYIVSNATEAGYVLETGETCPARDIPPATLPGKLAVTLRERALAGESPVSILPCELIPKNAKELRQLVAEQGRWWGFADRFFEFVDRCRWLENLVDCIVSDLPADDPLLKEHPGAVMAEPFALWAILRPETGRDLFLHPHVKIVEDLQPFHLRKVRILNGLHSAMVGKFLGRGFETVGEIMRDPPARGWVEELLFQEILPTIEPQTVGAREFASDVLDRFDNPFLQHKLADIALNHPAKLRMRLQPTYEEYALLHGHPPQRLGEVLERQLP